MTDTTIDISLGERSYPIHIGRGLLAGGENLKASISGPKVLIVSDDNVAGHYLETVRGALHGLAIDSLVLPPGEEQKNFANWQRLLDKLVAMGAQRDVSLLALGGGVIGDLTGFAAASYMRGVGFVQVPTSLLAQVDASVGGKTAINHPGGKNLIGAFHQPQAVVIDLATLDTLPRREYLAGLAEVIKMGLIRDPGLVDQLASQRDALLRRDDVALRQVIEAAVRHKARVVADDEREQGSRALLNLGHTFGHAVETLTGYGEILHGEAVAIGMVLAARMSARLGDITETEADRVQDLIEAFGLPTLLPSELRSDAMIEVMRLDKKNRAGKIRLVLLDAIGAARLDDSVSEAQLSDLLNSVLTG